ncbi:MAG: C39 family peptidase [Gemmatimonadaceae bacterium]|nr:C39 family peptidase [Gemmatimonadaceae bacterium]
MRRRPWMITGLAALCASCTTTRLRLPEAVPAAAAPAVALQVPYLAQTVLLCGGAAAAMVERWWGRRGVYAEQFASLVRVDEGGIRTTDLARVMRERGWTVSAAAMDAASVQMLLADSAPVIALIEVRPRRFHYVVITGWHDGVVIYHDPAASPFVRVDSATFLRRWSGSRNWAMVVQPSAAAITAPVPRPTGDRSDGPVTDALPCRPWLDRAADAAAGARLAQSEELLATAARLCPDEPVVLRELAGVRFLQGRHVESGLLAAEYAQRVPGDARGWQVLAASRYLAGDEAGALRAWRAVGKPVTDLLRIDGSRRIRFRVLADAIGITHGRVLTNAALALAARRLADVPALDGARVGYAAVAGGVVEVRAAVTERPLVDPLPQLLVLGIGGAIIRRDATFVVVSPLGAGETWSAQWRWQSSDPRLALRLSIPVRVGAPAVLHVERSWDRFRFPAGFGEERRSSTQASLTGWMAPAMEGLAGLRHERWADRGERLALLLGVGVHDRRDRTVWVLSAEHAAPVGRGRWYRRLDTRVTLNPPPDRWANRWALRAGGAWTSGDTPRGLQPLAGGDLLRDIPLRAHPYNAGGVLPATRISHRVLHGGASADRTITTRGPLSIGAGIFVDAAVLAPASAAHRVYVDGGAGLRFGLAGLRRAAIRVDVARGLVTDRRWGLHAGLAQPIPLRIRRAR